MIDHFTLTVSDYAATRAFYERVLAPLGYSVKREFPNVCGFGAHKPDFWIKQGERPTQAMHIAFKAPSRKEVDAFHSAALAAGAKDDGGPGVRAQYHPNYYGAFVIDPLNGHPIEAVCHAPADAGGQEALAERKKTAAKKAPKRAARKAPARKKSR